MPTLAEIAERLAETYGQLLSRADPSLDAFLDGLFEAVADLDTLAGKLPSPAVRAMLGR